MKLTHEIRSFFFSRFLLLLSAAQAGPEIPTPEPAHVLSATAPIPFAVDPRLQRNVGFWLSIYTQYDTSHGLIHDAKYIDHVYEVIDVSNDRHAANKAKRHWREVLLSLHKKAAKMGQGNVVDLTAEEKKVYDMYKDVSDPDKFLAAAHRKRLRFQLGQKDRFIDGLRMSGTYLPYMEDIFRKQGLPPELTRLPFVESGFNTHARSKVGASGIWQFMRSTGHAYLKINGAVDERNDPIRATEAAAKLLRLNYDSLNNWGLAVTAYNHGRMGMMRAVRQVGSDQIEDLVGNYRSRSFGFASSNFFSCLLAVIEAEKHAEQYFGKIERSEPLKFYEVAIPDSINLKQMAKFMKLDLYSIKPLNPALAEGVFDGTVRLPRGYRLRLPEDPELAKLGPAGEQKVFLAGYSEIPGVYKRH